MDGSNGRSRPSDGSRVVFGDTLEEAITIVAADTETGVAAEYTALEARFGECGIGWRFAKQLLLHFGGRHYDRIDIVLAGGTERSIYFDITSFFGRH